jgi:signal transduction histidine kinase
MDRQRLESRWLALLQEIAAASSHEVKGALNGVALNLEVVRSRSAVGEHPASALHGFASSSATQLEKVISMVEGLLAIARRPRREHGLGTVLSQIASLLGPAAEVLGGRIVIENAGSGDPKSSADPLAVRIVIADVLLAELRARSVATCRVTGGGDSAIFIERAGPLAGPIPEESTSIASDAGIRVEVKDDRTVLTFPAHGAGG